MINNNNVVSLSSNHNSFMEKADQKVVYQSQHNEHVLLNQKTGMTHQFDRFDNNISAIKKVNINQVNYVSAEKKINNQTNLKAMTKTEVKHMVEWLVPVSVVVGILTAVLIWIMWFRHRKDIKEARGVEPSSTSENTVSETTRRIPYTAPAATSTAMTKTAATVFETYKPTPVAPPPYWKC